MQLQVRVKLSFNSAKYNQAIYYASNLPKASIRADRKQKTVIGIAKLRFLMY